VTGYCPFSTSSSFLRRSSPLRLTAITLPSRSIRKLAGITESARTASQLQSHGNGDHLHVSSVPACHFLSPRVHSSFLRSSETWKISKPSQWYMSYIFTRLGFSSRHGGHHAAQKSTSTTLPLKEDRLSVSPSGSGRAIS
jgi:hypothetical protein